jgi:hypothetical protein
MKVIVGLLVELSGESVSLMDDFSRPDHFSEYTIMDIQDAKENLSLARPEGNLSDKLTDTVKAQTLKDSWRQTISQYLTKHDHWLSEATVLFAAMMSKIKLSLVVEQVDVLREQVAELSRLDKRLQSELRCVPKDAVAFYAFQDCVEWMFQFLQVSYYI